MFWLSTKSTIRTSNVDWKFYRDKLNEQFHFFISGSFLSFLWCETQNKQTKNKQDWIESHSGNCVWNFMTSGEFSSFQWYALPFGFHYDVLSWCVCVGMSNTINLWKIQVTSMYNKSKHVLYWLLIDESWSGKKKSASCRAICFNVTACKRGQKYKPQLNRSRSKKTNSFSCVCVWFNYGLPSYDCAFFRST